MAADVQDLKDTPLQFKPTQILSEREGNSKRVKVQGIFQKVGYKNANNRIYPESVWSKVLKDDSPFMKRLKEKKILGELEHPESGATHLGRVSHLISNVWREGDSVLGEAIILKTPSGAILEELFSVGVPVGISSRGSGSTKNEDGNEVVQEDYDLRTFDFVYDPSVEEAYPELVSEARVSTQIARVDESAKEEASMSLDLKSLLVQCGKTEEAARTALQSSVLSDVMEMHFCLADLISQLSETKSDEFKTEINIFKSKLTGLDQMISDKMKILSKPAVSEAGDTDPKKVIGPEGGEKTKLPPDQDKLTPEKDPKNSDLVTKTGKAAKESVETPSAKKGDAGVLPYGDVEKTCPECKSKRYETIEDEQGSIKGTCKGCKYIGSVRDFVPESKWTLSDKFSSVKGQLEAMKKKYGVSVELGEALVDVSASLADKAKTERRIRIVAEKKLASATKLLEATVARYKKEQLERFISSEIEKTPSLKAVESVIRKKATNISEAKELVDSLKGKITSEKTGREAEPLPPVGGSKDGGKELTEKSKETVGEGQSFLDTILASTKKS